MLITIPRGIQQIPKYRCTECGMQSMQLVDRGGSYCILCKTCSFCTANYITAEEALKAYKKHRALEYNKPTKKIPIELWQYKLDKGEL